MGDITGKYEELRIKLSPLSDWNIFGDTPVPSLQGGDSNHDAGVFIDILNDELNTKESQLNEAVELLRQAQGELADGGYLLTVTEDGINDYLNSIGGK